jgi:hypothetical protein
MKYSDSVATYSNDISKEKYRGVNWAHKGDEQCEEYVSRLKIEFLKRPSTYLDGSQYEEVRCRRIAGHKGACLNNRKYPG